MRRNETTLIVWLFLVASPAGAQQAGELLQPVNPTESLRLEEYNSPFLKRQLYFAVRYRIVKVNTALLLQNRDITVIPFDDVEPIELSPLSGTPQRYYEDEHVYWRGRYKAAAAYDVPVPNGPPALSVTIAMHSWDLDPSGNAVISSLNHFEFSPRWAFDDAGNPVLEGGDSSESIVSAGPPPQTPEQIERHKRLKTLKKHVFYSVDAVFQIPGSNKYVLQPLKYTPKYSVMYEIARDAVIPMRIDVEPGDPGLSENEKTVAARYEAFMKSLPKEADKPIREEVP